MGDGHSRIRRLAAAMAVLAGVSTLAASAAGASGTPRAEISINPAKGTLEVTFAAQSAGFPSPVVSFEWAFGDGKTATTSQATVTHEYANAAVFKPSVTERDAKGLKAVASGTIRLSLCPVGKATCTESLSNIGQVRLLQASGPVGAAARGSVNLFVGPFKIPQCQLAVVPTAGITDSGFGGNLTVTLDYTTTSTSPAKTTCFASTVPFVDTAGRKVTSGPLPGCQAVQSPPCVESTKISGSSVSKVLLIPPGDPKVGAP